jgi:hypothetical protein
MQSAVTTININDLTQLLEMASKMMGVQIQDRLFPG